MKNQKEAQDNLLATLAKLAAEELAKEAIPAGVKALQKLLHKIFDKRKHEVIEAADPVLLGPENCVSPKVWNPITKQCVDPIV